MNILVLNTQIPFCRGGAEVLAEDLLGHLRAAGHDAEILTLPFKWYPQQTLVNSILASKLFDITNFNGVNVDKVIALKFPMWLIPHPDMSLWILHQHRAAYDLWDSNLSDLASMPDGEVLRDLIRREDDRAVGGRLGEEAKSPGEGDGGLPLLPVDPGVKKEPAPVRGWPHLQGEPEVRAPVRLRGPGEGADLLPGSEFHRGGFPVLMTNRS